LVNTDSFLGDNCMCIPARLHRSSVSFVHRPSAEPIRQLKRAQLHQSPLAAQEVTDASDNGLYHRLREPSSSFFAQMHHSNNPQLGGATLTYSLLYLSLYIHRANRNVQKTLLSQQSALLNSVVEPLPPVPDPPAYEVRRAGLAEELKDRWNREVEKLVRNVQTTDWEGLREAAEDRIASAWSSVRQSETGREVEGRATELGEQIKTNVRDTVADGREKLRQTVDTSREKVKEAADSGGKKVQEAVVAGREKLEELGKAGEEKVREKTTGQPKRLLEIG
jgi:hypothetical protein